MADSGSNGWSWHDGEEDDNWLVAYADLLTNLLAFFVLLFAVSTVHSTSFEMFSESMSGTSGHGVVSLKKELDTLIKEGQLAIDTQIDRDGLAIRFQEHVLFDSASADISTDGQRIVAQVATMLAGLDDPRLVVVEGHADDRPIHTSRFESNWELSAQRAVNVARQLIDGGLAAAQVSAQAFGDTRPLAANDSEAARERNRRVVVKVR